MKEETIAFVEKMIEGDERAFDEIYHSYSGKLYRMAYFITGNKNDSEDVLQETFTTCFLHRRSLKDPERFDSWIYRILVRTSWKMGKKRKRQGELSYEGILEQGREDGFQLARRLEEDPGRGPLEQIIQQEASKEVRQVIGQLDIKYRTVVLLYYFNELGVKDIAEITGLFEGTVKSRLSRARFLLRQGLEKRPGEARQGMQPGKEKPRREICVKMNRHEEVSG